MTRYRNALPQLGDDLFLADGGIETTLIFLGGCCGTDHRHLEQIAESCVPLFHATT